MGIERRSGTGRDRGGQERGASLSPVQQLAGSLDAYLGWVERHADAYAKLITSVGAVPEVLDWLQHRDMDRRRCSAA